MAGHVFVVHGDLRRVACDAWLMPCDLSAVPIRRWVELAGADPSDLRVRVPPQWGPDGLRTLRIEGWPDGSPQPWLTLVGGSPKRGMRWYVEGARQFIEQASGSMDRERTTGRARPLLALPIVGTGYGGARFHAGDVLRELLPLLLAEARARDVDLALVTNEAPAWAAAQAERARLPDAFAALSPELKEDGERLAALASAGQLVLFIGAGVSQSAGLPGWSGLLAALAQHAGLDVSEGAPFRRLDALDQAAVLERKLGETALKDEVRRACERDRPSLSHFLLASLPVREAVTTNYDRLFEIASDASGQPVAVLPHEPDASAARWLLKLHGCVSRAEDIVLTRQDYLRYETRRAALAGIVQALLITRHMLFVGFSLKDDNFHRIADEVRRAVHGNVGPRGEFGTSLVLGEEPLLQQLWQGDVRWVPIEEGSLRESARQLEILLDFISAKAGGSSAHLLDDRFEGGLSDADRALREHLRTFLNTLSPEAKSSSAWGRIAALLDALGAGAPGRQRRTG